jgi:tRNA threonylcarbamoyl adenosine modification protein YeaZ
MLTLALEFSSDQRSAAVIRESAAAAPAVCMEVVETGGQAAKALGLIDEALHNAQVEREHVECIAVGLGPGSYTGIRAAIALAQGWHLATDVKLLGLSSAAAIVAQAHAEGLTGRVAVVIDAQRQEFYLANYALDPGGWRELSPLRLASQAEVGACEAAGEILVGPQVTKWFAAGRRIFPRAAVLGRLASAQTGYVPGERLEPIYLRETMFVKAPPPRVLPD